MVLDKAFLEIHRLCAVELLGDPLGLRVLFSGPRSQVRNEVLFQGSICVTGVGGGHGRGLIICVRPHSVDRCTYVYSNSWRLDQHLKCCLNDHDRDLIRYAGRAGFPRRT